MSVPLAVALPAMQQKMATQRRRDEEDARWTDADGWMDGLASAPSSIAESLIPSFFLSWLDAGWRAA